MSTTSPHLSSFPLGPTRVASPQLSSKHLRLQRESCVHEVISTCNSGGFPDFNAIFMRHLCLSKTVVLLVFLHKQNKHACFHCSAALKHQFLLCAPFFPLGSYCDDTDRMLNTIQHIGSMYCPSPRFMQNFSRFIHDSYISLRTFIHHRIHVWYIYLHLP